MQVEAQEAMREARNAWWIDLTSKGDPLRRPNLSREAFEAGFRAALSLNPQGDPAQSPNEGIERAASEPVAQYQIRLREPGHAWINCPTLEACNNAGRSGLYDTRKLYTRPQPSVDKPAEPSAPWPTGSESAGCI